MQKVKRSTENLRPVSLSYILDLIEKVDSMHYGYSIRGGFSPEEQKLRNKALISLLYLSARRISELVGRVLKDEFGRVIDNWEGVKVKHFQLRKVKGRTVLIMKCRILKKGRVRTWKERGVYPKKFAEIELDLEDKPFIDFVLEWLKHQQQYGKDTKLFDINRHRAYQILTELDPNVWNHWLRHQRFSHYGEYLSPYELNKRLGFWSSLEPALSYVHAKEEAYHKATKRIRQEWV